MKMSAIPFGITDWSQVERTEHRGERGVAYHRTRQFGTIRCAGQCARLPGRSLV